MMQILVFRKNCHPILQLSIIIVNYNVKYFLEQCLLSVQKACRNIESEIFVVDNHSSDGSKDLLQSRFQEVNFTWNDNNIGFAKANNMALTQAKGKYILFLNPDTIVAEDTIEKCIQFFTTHPDAGALGIRMIDGTGKFLQESKRSFPSPLTSLYKLVGLTSLFPRSSTFAKYYLGHLPENENHEIDVLAGAYMMVRKQVLQITGSFDEIFFMYGEDVDLSYRIQEAGFKNYYFSESTIIHFKGESTKRGSLNYIRLFYTAMSFFVKKHYKAGKAGIFNALIQGAIFIRASFAAAGKILQYIGLPLLDAGTILASFWLAKYYWSIYIRHEINYSPNVLMIAFPVFTLLFLFTAYYSGLYDKGYRQTRLIRAASIATLVLLSCYALLPEHVRFSRGILLLGITMAFVTMSVIRWLFIKCGLLEAGEHEERQQTILVCSDADFLTVTTLMQKAGIEERILGKVNNSSSRTEGALGNIDHLPYLVKSHPVKEVIFCENGLQFKEIITTIQQLPAGIRNKFHASGSSSIIGSDNKNISGEYVTFASKYRIADPIHLRNKNLTDVLIAIFFLISFPVHLVLQKNPVRFFRNVFAVLLRQKTWVGYAASYNRLPAIKKAVLTTTSLPAAMNKLPFVSLSSADEWYAKKYSVILDIKKLWRGYKYLDY